MGQGMGMGMGQGGGTGVGVGMGAGMGAGMGMSMGGDMGSGMGTGMGSGRQALPRAPSFTKVRKVSKTHLLYTKTPTPYLNPLYYTVLTYQTQLSYTKIHVKPSFRCATCLRPTNTYILIHTY
jgi:hypothetical protein